MITHPLAITLLRYRLLIILGATLILGGLFAPGYLSLSTLALSLDRGSTMGIIAVGMTTILISARIHHSSGSILAVSGIVMVMLQPVIGAWPAIAVGIGVGGVFGLLNGLIIVRLGVNAMIVTLASMLAIRSIAHLMTGSRPINGQDWTFGAALTGDLIGGFSSRVVIFLVLIAILHVWLTHTPSGRGLYAVGSNGRRILEKIKTIIEIFGEAKSSVHVAVPQIPPRAFQHVDDRLSCSVERRWHAPRHLLKHGDAHRDMEIVENVIGVGAHVKLEFAHAIAAIGHERHLLVHGDTLADQQFMQSTFRFLVVPYYKSEPANLSILGHGLSDDHLEICGPVAPVAHVAAVDADRDWWSRDRHLIPLGLASAREHCLLGTKLSFKTLCNAHCVVPDRRFVHSFADRQDVGQ